VIDLRSDTVTRPTPAMRRAIAEAEVGDDVFGDDPTVNRLQAIMADRLDKEAGLFVPSGTQSNLCALMAHCQRGDEYIVGQTAHTYKYEGGGAAVLGSIQPQPIEVRDDGTMAPAKIRSAIKPIDDHFARTRLICLENTTGGEVVSLDYIREVAGIASEHGLGLHLDGARLFNAVVATGIEARDWAEPFDTVSVCLSKGLGAPVGSVLVGPREFIRKARRWRKMLGGTMRQAGLLAAAGIHALQHHVERLAEDHANARRLQRGLASIEVLQVDEHIPTNMVFVEVPEGSEEELAAHCRARDIILYTPSNRLRLVTHLDVSTDDVDRVVEVISRFYES
jgi:threonine aldolase